MSCSERIDEVVRCWADLYEKETLEYGRNKSGTGDTSETDRDESEAFAQIFHSLVHSSPALSVTLAQLEHEHAVSVGRRCDEVTEELQLQQNSTADQMDLMVTKAKLESDVSHLKETQRREFRDWIQKVSESVRTKNSEIGIAPMSKSDSAFFMMSQAVSSPAPPSGGAVNSQLQESFTITLGAQMKQMHNLRLVAANPIQLIRYDVLGGGGGGGGLNDNFGQEDDWLPRRLQTAMSLYSHNLSGLVVLTECNLDEDTLRDTTEKISEICSRSTEYHFPNFEQQLESLKVKTGQGKRLKCGDFYMTRHSNLCEVHVVFHMLSTTSKAEGDEGGEEGHAPLTSAERVNSRHPVVMGLRSVLKTASLCGVTTLTIPLLLTMSLTDEMTSVSWCLRRAELVFKCVKGFMMEVASCGGGEDLKTLQFVVPKDIDQDVFNRLTSMLASIFRSSNPIRGS